MEGQERSGKVSKGHGKSYTNTRCVNNVRKVTGGGGWVGGLQDYSAIPWSRSLLFSEILRDSLTDFDWTGTGHGPGPAIAIKIFFRVYSIIY